MSMYILATGSLIADPVRRTSAAGKQFATASLRVATDDGPIFVSVVAFGDQADELIDHQVGQSIAISGRGKLTAWTGRDGQEKHGISVVAEQIASASAARRADTKRRRDREAA